MLSNKGIARCEESTFGQSNTLRASGRAGEPGTEWSFQRTEIVAIGFVAGSADARA
jgi:hypothetical protein